MKRKIALVLVCFMIMSIFAGCSQPAAETPAAAEPAAPVSEAAPAEEQPAAAEAPVEEAAFDPSTLQLAFVQGSIHPFFDPYEQAAYDACEDLGIPKIEYYVNSSAAVEEWSQIIDTLLAREVDGIVTQLSDSTAMKQKSLEIKDAGIYLVGVTSASVPDSGMEFSWCTDVAESAYQGTKNLIDAMGGTGKIVHLAGQVEDPNTIARDDGVKKAVAEYPGVEMLPTIGDVDDAELAQNAVNNLLATGQQVDGIIATGGGSTVGMCQALTQGGVKTIKAIGCDTDDITIQAIADGYITGTMSQNAYAQAYLGVVSLYYYAQGYTYKFPGELFQNSGFQLFDQSNYTDIEATLQKQTAEMKETVLDYFNPPA